MSGQGQGQGQVIVADSKVQRGILDEALGQESVLVWLGRLRPENRATERSIMKHFLLWLWNQPGWTVRMPSELLDFQENAERRERRLLLRLVKEFVEAKGGTYSCMLNRLSHLRQFWIANDVEFPSAHRWSPNPTREPVEGKLTFDRVREIILHAKPRDQAVFLTMLQGLMDRERFCQFNMKHSQALVKHLRAGRIDEPFRVDFLKGRKGNRRKYHTYIYRDALEAWQRYFERIRGWPEREGDPIAIREDRRGPVTKRMISKSFDTNARQLRIKPPMKTGSWDRSIRTGVAPHEAFRDVIRSRLQTAKKDGLDLTCVKFWMGHTIDPYHYNKFTDLEPEYVLQNAKIASKYLNIISNTTQATENKQELQELQAKMKKMEKILQMLQTGELVLGQKTRTNSR